MTTHRLPIEDGLERVPNSGELATALADVKRLRHEADEKAVELDRAIERLRILTESVPDPVEARRPVAVPQPLRPVASPGDSAPNEALLRATQMAVAGSARDEIEATLRDQYDVAEASRIVEQILGPARPSEAKDSGPDAPATSSRLALDLD